MKTLKQVLSAALVLAMLLSCVGAAPGEAEAQDGAPVQSEPFIENAPAPAEEVPAPEENIPAPAEEVPAPAEEVPAPAEEVPAPAEEAPAPAEDEPAPEAEIASVGEAAPVVAGSIAAKNGGWVYEGPVADAADKFVITAPEGYDDAVLALMFATEENGPFNSVIPSNVGTYWVKATWTKTGSEETAVAKTSFTISQKPVTFTLRSGLTKTYTGAEIVLSSKAGDLLTANGLVAADQGAAITINTGVINVQTAKPLDKVDVVIMRGDVPVSGNYAVTVNGNLTVVKASLEGATVTFTNPVYNGTAQLPAAAEVKLNGNVIPDTEYDIVAGAKTVTNVADTGGTATVRAKATAVNVQGSKEGEYSIAAFDLANATVELTDGGREYTGKPLAAPTVVVTGHGQPIPETGNYTVKFPDDLTNAGDKIVTVTAVENGNYKGEQSVTYTVVPKSLTDDMVTLETKQFVYNGTRQEAAVTAVKDGDATLTAGKDYTVAYTSDDSNALIAAGAVTVVVTGQGNYDGDITKTYEIAKKPVTVTAEGTKRFGAKDPTVDSPMADNWLRTTVTGLVNADDVNLFGIKAKRVPGANGELPGTYDIELTVDGTKAANYAVTGDDGDGVFTATIKDAFTISTKAAFTVSLGDGKKDASITTHTSGKVGYTITGKDLISDLQNYVDVTMNVDAKDASATLSSHGIQAKNVPATIPGAGGSISIPQVDYASGTMTWQSGLPAGAKRRRRAAFGQRRFNL